MLGTSPGTQVPWPRGGARVVAVEVHVAHREGGNRWREHLTVAVGHTEDEHGARSVVAPSLSMRAREEQAHSWTPLLDTIHRSIWVNPIWLARGR